MAWCLPKSEANKFRKALRDGTIHPEKLAEMTSKQRHEFFKDFIGSEEVALKVNSLFESKLLLKNQQRGYITWAKRVIGITPQTRRDLFAKIERLDRILEPKEEEQFLGDLVETRLGVGVTEEEAKNIVDMSRKIQGLKEKIKDDFTFESEADKSEYGRTKIALSNYVKELKASAGKLTPAQYLKSPGKIPSKVAGNAKAMKASMDNSVIFRQGWKTLWTHPGIWQRNARKTFVDIWRTFGKKEVMDELNADFVSRPNALNDNYKRMKLALGTVEEEFPESFAARIPVVGRVYKASENAFTAFVYKQRADIADKYIEIAEKSGVDLTDDVEIRSIGKLVNSLTGRGYLSRFEPAADIVNNVFFSPRFLKSNIDTLTLHALDKDFSKFARKQAAYNLLRIIMGTAAVLAVARAIRKDSVELDPRSADFGKIRVGDTRFDVSGGMASIVTLAARLVTLSSKSSTTSKITKLNAGEYGAQTGVDVVYNFFENKLSPAASVIKNLLKGETFAGEKITVTTTLEDLFIPISMTNYKELKDNPNSANPLAAIIFDLLGVGTNTYSVGNWETSKSVKIQQFKEVVGEKKFKRANANFNKRFNEWLQKTVNSADYKKLSDDGKKDLINDGKQKIQTRIFEEYGFEYEKAEKTEEEEKEEEVIESLQFE